MRKTQGGYTQVKEVKEVKEEREVKEGTTEATPSMRKEPLVWFSTKVKCEHVSVSFAY